MPNEPARPHSRGEPSFAKVWRSAASSEKSVRPAQKMQVCPYAFLWDYIYKRLELAHISGQLGVYLTSISARLKVWSPQLVSRLIAPSHGRWCHSDKF